PSQPSDESGAGTARRRVHHVSGPVSRPNAAVRCCGRHVRERRRVRAEGPRDGGAHLWRERRSGVAALLRPGAALRARRVPSGVVHAGRDPSQRRAHVSSWRPVTDRARAAGFYARASGMPLLVALLVVTFAIAGDLVHEAWTTARAQRETADRA